MSTHKPRRTILGSYHELAMAHAQRSTADLSTISLGTTAKGDPQIKEVTVRHEDADVAATKAREIFDRLRAAYPVASDEPALAAQLARTVDAVEQRKRTAAALAVEEDLQRVRNRRKRGDGQG
jgi:hypothetical protein